MITRELQATLNLAVEEAARRRNEFVTLEHLLLALLMDRTARDVLVNCGCDLARLRDGLEKFLAEHYESVEEYQPSEMPEQTIQFARVLQYALMQAEASGRREVDGGQILASLYQAEQSYAVYLLKSQGVRRLDVLNYISHGISKVSPDESGFEGWNDGEDAEGQEAADSQRDPLASFTVNLVERAAE